MVLLEAVALLRRSSDDAMMLVAQKQDDPSSAETVRRTMDQDGQSVLAGLMTHLLPLLGISLALTMMTVILMPMAAHDMESQLRRLRKKVRRLRLELDVERAERTYEHDKIRLFRRTYYAVPEAEAALNFAEQFLFCHDPDYPLDRDPDSHFHFPDGERPPGRRRTVEPTDHLD